MAIKKRAVHYINQFFAQIGGEEAADVGFSVKEGPVGPGVLLQKALAEADTDVEIVATIICGDNYFNEHLEAAAKELVNLAAPYRPDIFFAGPSFSSGRYGLACGEACKAMREKFGIFGITGMYVESPGVEAYCPHAYIAKTGSTAAKMADAIKSMVHIARNLLTNSHGHLFISGFGIGTPEEDNYFPQHFIRNLRSSESTSKRGVDMLLDKMAGRPFVSDMPAEVFEKVEPPAPIKDLAKMRIAIVSDGSVVDKANTPKLKVRNCDTWGKFDLREFMAPGKTADDYSVPHTGYHHVHVLEDRNRMVPWDVLEEMEKSGEIGAAHPMYYVMTGNCGVAKWSHKNGAAMAQELLNDKVDAVLLTSA